MARSPGFPSSRTISPSVRVVETDLSFYGDDTGHSIPALVGFAAKGPINTPVQITDIEDLRRKFGTPDPTVGSYLLYAAEQLVQDANEVWMVRVADTTLGSSTEAKTASIEIPIAGEAAYVQSGIAEGTPVVVTAGENDKLRFRVNGVLTDITITVPAGSYTSIVGEDGLRGAINTELGAGSQVVAEEKVDGSDSYLIFRSRNVYGVDSQIELVSVENSLYETLGMGSSMTAATLTSSEDRYPEGNSLAEFNLGSVSSPMLQVVVFGTGNATIDGVTQAIYLNSEDYLSASDIVDMINGDLAYNVGGDTNTPMGFFAKVESVGGEDRIQLITGTWDGAVGREIVGRDAKIVVRSSSTVDDILGFSNLGVTGTSPEGTINDDPTALGIVNGVAAGSGAAASFTVTADSAGTFGNTTQVAVSTDPISGNIEIRVYNQNSYKETFGGMHKNEFAADTTYYIENVVNTTSDFIKVIDNTDTEATPLQGTYTLSGGTNGIPVSASAQADLLVGTEASQTGLFNLSNPEAIDIDTVAIPGVSTTRVIESMIDFCENQRQDCVAIIDPPAGMSALDVIKWHNGQHYLNLTKFDSSYAALYWPWIQVRDKFNGQDVWIPPSGNVMGAFALTERDYGVWFAPAGAERGLLRRAKDVEVIPFLEDRDRLYGNENCVNPLIRRPGGDVMIWGQKSMQRAQSALDRINVRRLLLSIKKDIQLYSQDLIFRPHTQKLREEFVSMATRILEKIRLNEGLNDYEIQCDAKLNPPEVIDRNELRARIGIQPTKASEYFFIEMVVQNTAGEPDTTGGLSTGGVQ